jgi:hypothetical protein
VRRERDDCCRRGSAECWEIGASLGTTGMGGKPPVRNRSFRGRNRPFDFGRGLADCGTTALEKTRSDRRPKGLNLGCDPAKAGARQPLADRPPQRQGRPSDIPAAPVNPLQQAEKPRPPSFTSYANPGTRRPVVARLALPFRYIPCDGPASPQASQKVC